MRRFDDFKLVSLWFGQAALLWLHSKLRLLPAKDSGRSLAKSFHITMAGFRFLV
jgi:hypothetical protein